MHMNLKSLAVIAAISLSAGAAIAQDDAAADTVVATVNGTDITLGEMIIAKAQLPAQYQQLPDEVLFAGILDQLVQQQLLADTLEEVPARLTIALANEERSLRAGEVVNGIYENTVTEDALNAAYEARIAELGETKEFNASHILVETEEEAQEIKELIEGGADFAATAQERSTGPSGPNGGELGWFGPGMMVAPFEEAVMTLEVGQVSGPVQTQFGWHIVKLNDMRTQEAPTLDDLRAELTAQIQEDALMSRIDELQEAAEITLPEEGAFDPALISNLDLLED